MNIWIKTVTTPSPIPNKPLIQIKTPILALAKIITKKAVSMSKKTKPCLVACNVLQKEIEKLVKEAKLDADLVFVSKNFHVDYALIEKYLPPVIEKTLKRYPDNVVLVYGDLCLGMNNEMKKLADRYGIVKVDALNCVDCQLGGKGKFVEADPNHELMFLTPGMTDFFRHAKETMRKEGVDEAVFKQFFTGIKGIILLDTLGDAAHLRTEVEQLETGLRILEVRALGCENVRNIIQEAIEENKKHTGKKFSVLPTSNNHS